MSVLVALGRKFARLATNAVVRAPWLWRLYPTHAESNWNNSAETFTGRSAASRLTALHSLSGR